MESDPDNGDGLVGSPINETDALMEADEEGLEILLEERTKSIDSTDGTGDRESETSKLLNSADEEPHPASTTASHPHSRQESQSSCSMEPKSPREVSYAYHFKKKYTFRSDSVYSDVTPMSSASSQVASSSTKNSESRDKSGSLSSLGKSSQSKWVSLKKKLSKINSLSSGKSKPSPSSSQDEGSQRHQQASSTESSGQSAAQKPIKSLTEKRTLLQRAKTLSILPINSAPKNKEPPQQKKVVQPPELFNVGGEMNLIPLEMLIDINDIKRPQQ